MIHNFSFNSVVVETFARLDGVLALMDTLDDGIPAVEEKEHSYLERLAKEGDWEYEDYVAERDVLNQKFRIWAETFAAYSATILLYSIVETQLDALAKYVGEDRHSNLRVGDMAGKGADRAASYLERVQSIPVMTLAEWDRLKDLQTLRNVIVHRGGKLGNSLDEQNRLTACGRSRIARNTSLQVIDSNRRYFSILA